MYVLVRKRGHPKNDELLHYGVQNMEWGKRVQYIRGVGWMGDGVSKKLGLPAPFQGRTKQYGGYGPSGSKASTTNSSGTKKSHEHPKNAPLANKNSSRSSSSGGGGGGPSGMTYNAELRAKLDAAIGSSDKAQKAAEKAQKEAEREEKKKKREEEQARKKAEAEAKKKQREEEQARKKAEAEQKKAYRERLAIERQARQLFEKWKQEEVERKRKKDNTLKKSQVTMVADRGKMRSWNASKNSRRNSMK